MADPARLPRPVDPRLVPVVEALARMIARDLVRETRAVPSRSTPAAA